MGAFLTGTRYLVHFVYEQAVQRLPRAARRALGADRRRRRRRPRCCCASCSKNPELGYRPVGFVDDDRARSRAWREVLGTTDDLDEILEDVEPDEVLIAIPSAPGTLRAKVVSACRARNITVRTMPTVFELLQTGGSRLAPAARRRRSRTSSAASPCGWRSSPSAAT